MGRTHDALRALRERVEDDIAEVPGTWIAEYHAILDSAPEVQYRFAMRVPRSALHPSTEAYDELSRPLVERRTVCDSDEFLHRVNTAIAFYETGIGYHLRKLLTMLTN